MQLQITINSDDPQDVQKAKKILAILDGEDDEPEPGGNGVLVATPAPPPGNVADLDKITALAKTKTGQPLREAAQRYQAAQQFSLSELGARMGWSGSKSVSWYAKFSRTCKAWGVRPLQRHQGFPKRYSMTEEVRQAVLRAIQPPPAPQAQPQQGQATTA